MIVRPAHPGDETGLALVHLKTWTNTYRGLLDDALLDALNLRDATVQWVRTFETGRTRVFLAQNERQQVVGYVSGGRDVASGEAYDSEIYTLYVLPQYQRMGLGNRLIRAAAAQLREDGANSLIIWVLKGNLAAEFYRKMGGLVVAEKTTVLGRREYREIAFGWSDLGSVGYDPFAISHREGTAH